MSKRQVNFLRGFVYVQMVIWFIVVPVLIVFGARIEGGLLPVIDVKIVDTTARVVPRVWDDNGLPGVRGARGTHRAAENLAAPRPPDYDEWRAYRATHPAPVPIVRPTRDGGHRLCFRTDAYKLRSCRLVDLPWRWRLNSHTEGVDIRYTDTPSERFVARNALEYGPQLSRELCAALPNDWESWPTAVLHGSMIYECHGAWPILVPIEAEARRP